MIARADFRRRWGEAGLRAHLCDAVPKDTGVGQVVEHLRALGARGIDLDSPVPEHPAE